MPPKNTAPIRQKTRPPIQAAHQPSTITHQPFPNPPPLPTTPHSPLRNSNLVAPKVQQQASPRQRPGAPPLKKPALTGRNNAPPLSTINHQRSPIPPFIPLPSPRYLPTSRHFTSRIHHGPTIHSPSHVRRSPAQPRAPLTMARKSTTETSTAMSDSSTPPSESTPQVVSEAKDNLRKAVDRWFLLASNRPMSLRSVPSMDSLNNITTFKN